MFLLRDGPIFLLIYSSFVVKNNWQATYTCKRNQNIYISDQNFIIKSVYTKHCLVQNVPDKINHPKKREK